MFRGVGDPVLDERGNGTPSLASRGTLANVTSQSVLRAASLGGDLTELFGDIPHTAIELEALRRLLKAPPESVSVGYAATESALKHSNFTGVDVIALATHGVLGGEIPWVTEPALIFTPPKTNSNLDDGVLKASEAAVLQLSAELVILSACNTAGPSEREGPGVEGLSGLARAFFYAGARSLLASHWPVYDEVAERLTVLTVQELDTANESAKAVALQRAIIAVRDDKHKDWSHPSVWAPLVLVGDSR